MNLPKKVLKKQFKYSNQLSKSTLNNGYEFVNEKFYFLKNYYDF